MSIIIFLILFISVFFALIYKRNIHLWLLNYMFGEWRRNRLHHGNGKKHIIFCYVDHFEPHHGGVDDETARARMDVWLNKYPELADRYIDADGNKLKHTWFYPYDELMEEELVKLNQLVKEGYGEVEFHLHHKDDTSESLKDKLNMGLRKFNEYGIGITEDGKKCYAFIHGNWALDNSIIIKGQNFCGVNDEISILKETGCIADYTFPAYLEKSQPALVNTIFYAVDDPAKPKSYNKGHPVEVNNSVDNSSLMLIQGPLMINWRRRKFGILPNIEDGNIHEGNRFHSSKIDLWVKSGIRVKGKHDWIFVKIFTHGAPEKNYEVALGSDAYRLFDYLTEKYNDGQNYSLHFVTAREMYNIVKAAENDCSGNPNEYRNYVIKPYKNVANGHL